MQTEDQIPGITDEEQPLPQVDELEELKAKAALIGMTYHPKIGVEALREKLAAFIAANGAPKETVQTTEQPVVAAAVEAPAAPAPEVVIKKVYRTPKQHADFTAPDVPGETAGQRRLRKKKEALELVRVRVTCMNPAKKEWEGEIFTAGNNTVTSITKYIPFGNDEGWHIPRIIYNVIRDREAQIFVTVKDDKGRKVRTGKMIKEFAIEVLEPLSLEELGVLAARQAATHAIDN